MKPDGDLELTSVLPTVATSGVGFFMRPVDIVVLDGNPLDDIGVVAGEGENVAYVMQRGTIVKARAALH